MGGAAVEKRGDGELELAGVRVGGGGVLGVWGGELARERGNWNAGVLLVLKCMREGETGALPRACHGGGEVAAAEHDRGSVARERGLQRGWSGTRGLRGCRMWRWAAGGGLPQRKQRGREVEDTGWTCLQFQKSLGVLL